MKARNRSIGAQEIRNLAAYTVSDASHYLRIPTATVRSWVVGRRYPTKSGSRFFDPVVETPSPRSPMLSFTNLVEAHVLDALRREHKITLDKVRRAIEYLKKEFGTDHPLADQAFETDGIDVFINQYGDLINITQQGQLAMRQVLAMYLRRVERDAAGFAIRLYPFTRKRLADAPRVVMIDPSISFGRPVLVGTGVPTSVIAERYKAGDSVEELAGDYGRPRLDIEEAIRCELQVEAA